MSLDKQERSQTSSISTIKVQHLSRLRSALTSWWLAVQRVFCFTPYNVFPALKRSENRSENFHGSTPLPTLFSGPSCSHPRGFAAVSRQALHSSRLRSYEATTGSVHPSTYRLQRTLCSCCPPFLVYKWFFTGRSVDNKRRRPKTEDCSGRQA